MSKNRSNRSFKPNRFLFKMEASNSSFYALDGI